MACADPKAYGHAEACAARDGWRFVPEVVTVPASHLHWSFSYNPDSSLLPYEEQERKDAKRIAAAEGRKNDTEEPEEDGQQTVKAVAAKLAKKLSRPCPDPKRWYIWAAKLRYQLELVGSMSYGNRLPKLAELVKALAATDDIVLGLWHDAATEAAEWAASFRTEATDYRNYLRRLISLIENHPHTLSPTLQRELMGAKILDFASLLANNHREFLGWKVGEDAASEFAVRTWKYVSGDTYDGRDLKKAMARDFFEYFSRSFRRKQLAKKNAAFVDAAKSLSFSEFEDEGSEAEGPETTDDLTLAALATTTTEREQAAGRVADIWPALSGVERTVATGVLEGSSIKQAANDAGISAGAATKRLRRVSTRLPAVIDIQAAADDLTDTPLFPSFAELAERAGVSL